MVKDASKYKLDVNERILLLGLLPPKGNLVTMRIVSELRESVGFNEKEIKGWEITTGEGSITWNTEKAKTKEIIIGPTAMSTIKETVEDLDKKGEIIEQVLPLLEKLGL